MKFFYCFIEYYEFDGHVFYAVPMKGQGLAEWVHKFDVFIPNHSCKSNFTTVILYMNYHELWVERFVGNQFAKISP